MINVLEALTTLENVKRYMWFRCPLGRGEEHTFHPPPLLHTPGIMLPKIVNTKKKYIYKKNHYQYNLKSHGIVYSEINFYFFGLS